MTTALKGEIADLEGKIEKLTDSSEETQKGLESIQELIARMRRLKSQDQERIDLRKSLRGQLRRLLTKIRVSPSEQDTRLYFQNGQARLLSVEEGQLQVLDRTIPPQTKIS